MASTLVNISSELAAIVKTVGPHVVTISARRHHPASGIRWNSEVIVTADHAIRRDEDITVTLADGKTASATLVGRDPGSDLAVLKLQSPIVSSGELPRAASAVAGELALVIGRSPNSGANASLGIVSAVSGEWRTWRGGQLDAYIRLDAKLFPNSSGGAVVNARGELLGIATAALSRVAGLAIPASNVSRTTEKLLERGFVPRAYLGIGIQVVELPEQLRTKLSLGGDTGLMILTVEPGSPSDKAGVMIGDILIAMEGTTIERAEDLQQYSDSSVIGKSMTLKFVRGGAVQDLPVVIGERPRRQS